MKRIVLIAGVLLIVFLPAMSWAADEILRRVVFDQIGKSEKTAVGKIFIENSFSRYVVTGSGFVVDANGIIATNDHVIRGGNIGGIIIGNNYYWFKEIIYSNEQYDIALMQVDVKMPLSPLKLGNYNNEEIGNEVYVISSPGRLENVLSQGRITGDSMRIEGGGIYFPISATIDHGSSGAPVLNGKGEVIGIIALGRENIPIANQNWAIPINLIKDKIPSKISIDENKNEKNSIVVLFVMKDGSVFGLTNYFMDREAYKYSGVLFALADQNDIDKRYCTYKYGGTVCFARKDDVASIVKLNE